MDLRHIVIVGAGLAGAQSLMAMRSQGFTGRITVLGAEAHEPYDRPPLSKELFTRDEPAWLRDELGTDLSLADDVRLGTSATGLRVRNDGIQIEVEGADPVLADAAILATGAYAARPWPSALTLHTAADAAELRTRLVPGARLVIVGAGWIGAEVAGSAALAGVDVTVVEAAPAPLSAALGSASGSRTAPWYADAGVRLLTGTTVKSVEGRAVTVTGPSGPAVLEADVVLAAVGARPTTAWLRGSVPLRPDGSVEVDEHHRVLLEHGPEPRLVAVGDLAARRSARYGLVPGGHWDSALRTPGPAVRALLAHPERPDLVPGDDPVPYVFSTQFGHELALLGTPGPGDDVVERSGEDGWTMLWLGPDDVLSAALVVDRPHDVGGARKLLTGAGGPARVDRTPAGDPGVPLRKAVAG